MSTEQESTDNLLPINSPTLLMDDTTSRFSSAIWYNKIREKSITLAGIGGIGSYVGFLLARVKPKAIFIYDDDTVDEANMSGQLYGLEDVGKTKVGALAEMVSNYANYYGICGISERFTADTKASDIMICGFDNMVARKNFFPGMEESCSEQT